MNIYGLPETFWVVTKPSPVSVVGDICYESTFAQLLLQARGGLHEDDIVGVYADEIEAKKAAAELLDETPVTSNDSLAVEVLVHLLVVPEADDLSIRALSQATVEAVRNAVAHAEKKGIQHQLAGKATIGMGPVKLHEATVLVG
jgi:hypothetical protein